MHWQGSAHTRAGKHMCDVRPGGYKGWCERVSRDSESVHGA
jgi:hypothetical protein